MFEVQDIDVASVVLLIAGLFLYVWFLFVVFFKSQNHGIE